MLQIVYSPYFGKIIMFHFLFNMYLDSTEYSLHISFYTFDLNIGIKCLIDYQQIGKKDRYISNRKIRF